MSNEREAGAEMARNSTSVLNSCCPPLIKSRSTLASLMGFGRLLLDPSSTAADSNTRVRPHYARGRRGVRFLEFSSLTFFLPPSRPSPVWSPCTGTCEVLRAVQLGCRSAQSSTLSQGECGSEVYLTLLSEQAWRHVYVCIRLYHGECDISNPARGHTVLPE